MNNLVDWFNDLFNPDKKKKTIQPYKEQLFYKSDKALIRKRPILPSRNWMNFR